MPNATGRSGNVFFHALAGLTFADDIHDLFIPSCKSQTSAYSLSIMLASGEHIYPAVVAIAITDLSTFYIEIGVCSRRGVSNPTNLYQRCDKNFVK